MSTLHIPKAPARPGDKPDFSYLRTSPAGAGARAVLRNERGMRVHWMYETPAAWVHGRWYFAHDRPRQIGEWLDQLGWCER